MLVLTYTQVLADLLTIYKTSLAREQIDQAKATFLARKGLRDWLYSVLGRSSLNWSSQVESTPDCRTLRLISEELLPYPWETDG